MRIAGYLLLIVGLLFAVLFALAAIGGASLPPQVYAITLMMVVSGWRLKAAGAGKQVAPAGPAGAVAPNGAPGTVELALSPDLQAKLARQASARRRPILIVVPAGVTLFLGFGLAVDLAASSPAMSALPIMSAIAALFGLIVGGVWYFFGERPLRSDLQSAIYLRSSGAVRISTVFGGFILRIGDRSFMITVREASALRKLSWATVEYSPRAHVVFEVRDRAGNCVYTG